MLSGSAPDRLQTVDLFECRPREEAGGRWGSAMAEDGPLSEATTSSSLAEERPPDPGPSAAVDEPRRAVP